MADAPTATTNVVNRATDFIEAEFTAGDLLDMDRRNGLGERTSEE